MASYTMKETAGQAIEMFASKLDKAREAFSAISSVIRPLVETHLLRLARNFDDFTTICQDVVLPIVEIIIDIFLQLSSTIAAYIAPSIQKISDKFNEFGLFVGATLNNYVLPAIRLFIQMIRELWEENQDKITAIGELFQAVFELIASIVSWFVGVFKDYIYPLFEWLYSIVSSNMENIKAIFQSGFDIIGGIVKLFTSILKGDWSGAWSAVKSIAGGALNFLTSTIKTKLDLAKSIVSSAVQKLKSLFNFKWELPKIKLPHFSISGKFSLDPPSIPKFGVEWYAKGAVLNQPTIFGVNPSTGKAMGGGEAGAEAVAPIATLQEYIRNATNERDKALVEVLSKILDAILQLDDGMSDKLIKALLSAKFKINDREFARLVREYA